MKIGGNFYLGAAIPYRLETNSIRLKDFDADIQLKESNGKIMLHMVLPEGITKIDCPMVTTAFIGKTKISESKFENPEGTDVSVDIDFFGNRRDQNHIVPGPFADIKSGKNEVVILK